MAEIDDADRSLAAVALHAPCGLLATEPRGVIVAVNATILSWLGYERDEVVGCRRFQDFMRVGGKIFFDTHLGPLLRMQGWVEEIAVELRTKEGGSLPVLVSANEKRDEREAVEMIRFAVYRAADRRAYERELLLARRMAEQSLKAKADFMAVFAHDVRNSLAATRTAAELLRDAGVPPAGERPLSLLEASLERVVGQLQSLLDYSKIEAGKAELDHRLYDVREVVHGALQTLEPVAASKRLELRADVAEDVPATVVGDPVKVAQVLNNLIGNAVKFTPEGSVVVELTTLCRTEDDALIRVRVRDTGIGIPADRLETVFDEYRQADSNIGASYGGSGLGLAICRRIVELHGTSLRVESELGVGSTFTFDLPVALPPAEPKEPGSGSP